MTTATNSSPKVPTNSASLASSESSSNDALKGSSLLPRDQAAQEPEGGYSDSSLAKHGEPTGERDVPKSKNQQAQQLGPMFGAIFGAIALIATIAIFWYAYQRSKKRRMARFSNPSLRKNGDASSLETGACPDRAFTPNSGYLSSSAPLVSEKKKSANRFWSFRFGSTRQSQQETKQQQWPVQQQGAPPPPPPKPESMKPPPSAQRRPAPVIDIPDTPRRSVASTIDRLPTPPPRMDKRISNVIPSPSLDFLNYEYGTDTSTIGGGGGGCLTPSNVSGIYSPSTRTTDSIVILPGNMSPSTLTSGANTPRRPSAAELARWRKERDASQAESAGYKSETYDTETTTTSDLFDIGSTLSGGKAVAIAITSSRPRLLT